MVVKGLGALRSDPSVVRDPAVWFQRAAELLQRVTARQPLVVGVFQNQPAAEVFIIRHYHHYNYCYSNIIAICDIIFRCEK